MPRIQPSESELQNRRTRAAISHNMEELGITEEDLAKRLGCTIRTIQNKRRKPETITLPELRILAKYLKMTSEQVVELIGVNGCGK